ncbi:MAG: alcohol dehydrogenase catalytic domain-containing protein [Acidobacteria bacterium]|nr:alcohol dehydrogenase catalytic domain-containing protein [Acidobacteriota bacterium]
MGAGFSPLQDRLKPVLTFSITLQPMRAVQIVAPNQPLAAASLPSLPPGAGEVTVEIAACGICPSDAHYRSGFGDVAMPRTPGHEVAGVVRAIGEGVSSVNVGDRVAVHYLRTCRECRSCTQSGEQFCESGEMIGKHRDGGYAEFLNIPDRNAVPVPANVPLEIAALMMCSTATAFHALRVARMQPGETVALLGFGGLGVSGLELAKALGAKRVAVVDVVPEKRAFAESRGAEAFADAGELRDVDVAIDFTGRAAVATAGLRALRPGGRLMVVALSEEPISLNPYRDLVAKERSIVGCSDHLRSELVELLEMASTGRLDLRHAISRRVALDANEINEVLDTLDRGTSALRTVITRSLDS